MYCALYVLSFLLKFQYREYVIVIITERQPDGTNLENNRLFETEIQDFLTGSTDV